MNPYTKMYLISAHDKKMLDDLRLETLPHHSTVSDDATSTTVPYHSSFGDITFPSATNVSVDMSAATLPVDDPILPENTQ